jgi:hypothetical protein
MFKLNYLLPALMFFAAVPTVSEAQLSVPLYTTTYKVQVEWSFWRSGGTYWETVFTTEDQDDAELMSALLDMALEAGNICDFLDCEETSTWIPVDVRLLTEKKYNYDFLKPQYESLLPYQQNWFLKTAREK